MADQVSEQREAEAEGTLGLPQATALIMGSIIGTGVFTLPASLAAFGMISIWAFVVCTVGALALALLFGALEGQAHRRGFNNQGGPYAYAREGFGEFTGFMNAWSYWITAWVGNAAIVVAWVGYCEVFVNKGGNKLGSIIIALIGLWIPAAINLRGVGSMGSVQLITTIIKFIPLVFISTVGLFFINGANFPPLNITDQSTFGALGSATALAVFSYLGVETASVAAAKVKDPQTNVPRATLLGTAACAVVYIISTIAVFGIVPNSTLQNSSAPYSDAFIEIFGGNWAGKMVALFAIVSGFGALNGWTMIVAETSLAAAKDGVFPAGFGRVSPNGVPAVGIIAGTVLASVAMVLGYSKGNVFNTLVLVSGITAAVPYAFSALAQLKWKFEDRAGSFAKDVAVGIVALLFAIMIIWGSVKDDFSIMWWSIVVLALGLPVFFYQRSKTGPTARTA